LKAFKVPTITGVALSSYCDGYGEQLEKLSGKVNAKHNMERYGVDQSMTYKDMCMNFINTVNQSFANEDVQRLMMIIGDAAWGDNHNNYEEKDKYIKSVENGIKMAALLRNKGSLTLETFLNIDKLLDKDKGSDESLRYFRRIFGKMMIYDYKSIWNLLKEAPVADNFSGAMLFCKSP